MAAMHPASTSTSAAHGVVALVSSTGMPYLLRTPRACASAPPASSPVLLFLHGAGESGGAPAWRLIPGYDAASSTWSTPAPTRGTLPGLAVDSSPLLGDDFLLISPVTSQGWTSRRVQDDVLALLDEVLHAHACGDAARVLLTGISMGGNGAIALGAAHPSRFAGVSPICGWGELAHAQPLSNTPMWVAHGDNDIVIPASASSELVDALRAAGNTRVEHKTFEKSPAPQGYEMMAGHDSWTATYGDAAWWRWARALPPRG